MAGTALQLLLWVQPGAATPVQVVLPTGSEVLTAGQLVELRWHGLPDEVDEMELLLEIDNERQARFRLTRQLGAATRRYLWQVPNIPSTPARLRLRWGQNGVETEGQPGTLFVIRTDLRAPVNQITYHQGEWWLASGQEIESLTGGLRYRLIESLPAPALTATVSELTDVSPDEPRSLQAGVPVEPYTLEGCRTAHPEVAARRPRSIPLRP